jgi:ubiquinone/menaquinone biosynthesis C-methylase UbiE
MKDSFREFYESVGSKYAEDSIIYHTLSGRVRKNWIMQKLDDLPEGSLLDCGCNIGTLSRNWRKGMVYGVDIAHSVLAKGRKHSPRINFVQADIRDLGMFKDDSVVNAIACEVVEHLDKPETFFAQVYRIMKKGGHILVTSPNFVRSRPRVVSLGIMRSFGVTRGTEGNQYLHTAYKPFELASMAGRAGFTVLDRGSFEFELRGWLKPLTIIRQLSSAIITRLSPVSRMNYMIEKSVCHLEIELFQMLDVFGFSRLLKKLFKEGRRSYIVARK